MYSLSIGTKKEVTTAAKAAIQKTVFFFKNLITFKLSPGNSKNFQHVLYYKEKPLSINVTNKKTR